MSQKNVKLAVIGGSGLYNMPFLTVIDEIELNTPFGKPSDSIMIGDLEGVRVAFLSRHGRGHPYLPHEVPYRANIHALKQLGVEQIVAISACGSLREDYAPGHIVIPDQLFDHTKGKRDMTFFGDGLATHIGVADPFCNDICGMLNESVRGAGGTVHAGGTYITVEGPRFSTRGESNVYRSWGMSIIGMTTSPEAYLAREAEICYGVMAHVTDYDVWHESEEAVSVEMVLQTTVRNLALAQKSLVPLVKKLVQRDRTCGCDSALASAIITDRRKIPQGTLDRLGILIDKYIS